MALPYKNADSDAPILTCAVKLPRDMDSLMKYSKGYRVNGKTERIIFHVRFLSWVPMMHLKWSYYPDIGRVGRLTMDMLKKRKIWFKSQQCAETRVARLGWFLLSHTTDDVDNFRAQLRGFWRERGLVFPEDQWQIAPRRFTVTSSSKKS